MSTPDDGQTDRTKVVVSRRPIALVTISGPTEQAAFDRVHTWKAELGGNVVIVAVNPRGFVADGPDSLFQLDVAVDLSAAMAEGRWPTDWFYN